MDREELLNRVFKRPLIVASTEYQIPTWMKAKIREERINQTVKGRKKATNAEVFAYLYTLSKIQPFSKKVHRIYLFLFHHYMCKRRFSVPENFPEIEELKKEEEKLLEDLKEDIYSAQESHSRAKRERKNRESITLNTFL